MKITNKFLKFNAVFTLSMFITSGGITSGEGSNFFGSDDFAGSTYDTNKWYELYSRNNGTLSQNDGMYYSTSSATDDGYAYHEWSLNEGSYSDGWTVQLDVSVLCSTLTELDYGDIVSFGLALENNSDPYQGIEIGGDWATLGLSAVWNGEGFSYALAFETFTDGLPEEVFVEQSYLSSATIRLLYDANSHTVFAQYDNDGTWVTITDDYECGDATFTIDETNWNMSNSDTFGVAILGTSGSAYSPFSVSEDDNIFGANFFAVPEPGANALCALGVSVLLFFFRKFKK
ncbi:MAG: hypothetical protein JW728_02000 [Candidatus Aureabacteria bacterium]|nr:hypothetical protein [Candidatus Auribacterota bacterium]